MRYNRSTTLAPLDLYPLGSLWLSALDIQERMK